MGLRKILTVALFTGFVSTQLFAGAEEARRIAEVSKRANALVNRILASRGGGVGTPTPGVGTPGVGIPGTPTPGSGGGVILPWLENDALALPIFMDAAGQTNLAANYAFESQLAFLNGQIQFAVFKFTSACARLSTGKLALSRANFAALLPPAGFFSVFNAEVINMLTQIELARQQSGCL